MLDTESTNTLTFRKDSNTKMLKKSPNRQKKTKQKYNLNTTERSFMTLYCIVVVWFSCTNQRVIPPPVIQILACYQSTEDCYGYV